MAGEIQLNSVSLATESSGTVTLNSSTDIKGCLNASGSAPIYACRAWINFDGSSASIGTGRANGNVSGVTDNGGSGGDYTITFATALPDANYSVVGNSIGDHGTTLFEFTGHVNVRTPSDLTTSSARILVSRNLGGGESDSAFDSELITIAIFR